MTDIHLTFPGCTPQGINAAQGNGATFPCIVMTNNTCTTCYFGYTLVNTTCTYNPCNSDEYFFNQTCIKASIFCLTFDRFTGACLTCVTSNYNLSSSGACVLNVCGAGSTNRLNTCVNNYCNGFVDITGACTSCINNAFEFNAGVCSPVRCLASNLYFSFAVQACIPYPTYCTSINFITERCLTCISPFTLNAGTSRC